MDTTEGYTPYNILKKYSSTKEFLEGGFTDIKKEIEITEEKTDIIKRLEYLIFDLKNNYPTKGTDEIKEALDTLEGCIF